MIANQYAAPVEDNIESPDDGIAPYVRSPSLPSGRRLPRREHARALRTLHLLGADALDLGWRDRVTAGWAGCILRGHDILAVDFILAHRVILTLRAISLYDQGLTLARKCAADWGGKVARKATRAPLPFTSTPARARIAHITRSPLPLLEPINK